MEYLQFFTQNKVIDKLPKKCKSDLEQIAFSRPYIDLGRKV